MTAHDGSLFDLAVGASRVFEQRRVLAAMLDAVSRTAWRGRRRQPPVGPPAEPGPELAERAAAPSSALVRAYCRHLGMAAEADRAAATVPAHLFPQWTFPTAARVLRALPYPLARILNAGCRLQINAAIPASAPLVVRARLLQVTDDGRRALLHQRLTTDTPEAAGALVADVYAVAPVGPRAPTDGDARAGDDAGRVPWSARELARIRVAARAGLAYGFLTGDFNPVHWAPAYARAAGFRSPILHGFALMARAMECLRRTLFAGAADRLRVLDVRFKRPLMLGRGVEVGVYRDDAVAGTFYVADAPGVRPYLVGSFEASHA